MFTTKVEIPKAAESIGYEDNIMTLGSCFSENIGKKLQESSFLTDVNPFGVLYNPMSIYRSLRHLLDNQLFSEKDLFSDGSLWHSFSHSSLFSGVDKEKCLNGLNAGLKKSSGFLRTTKHLLVTFGTAWVYEYKDNGCVVSNCHKLPAGKFNRVRLGVDEIVNKYSEIIKELNRQNAGINIIFTVSPIRHWKDGAHENNISKGILLQAIDVLQKRFENVGYFPAYEILLDELRDYRYYAPDMLHPSDVAVSYIWERFSDAYFSEETLAVKKRVEQLKADLSHRPLHPEADAYKKFLEAIDNKREKLVKDYPFLADRLMGY
ncbi:GSCFA domain protein [Paludibacter sp. 221]|uniref:GSCFA domain-containing protein n=1 Tax=Paludibacter sp. 221 TaxID=2302939 RepID=UPI0013D8CAA1|nr:GSCFA domain-containing protein [Paludibacter sp. 221]NDV46842.1 GSCFA domain protein [Paludibacter sp. 221]